jgi:hypothetical protein
MITKESKLIAGIILITVPTIAFGGTSLLGLLINDPTYSQNQLRQDLWRAGHAHAGVLVILSLLALQYVDLTNLSEKTRWLVRITIPASAVLLPLAFFLSVLSPTATSPNGFIYLAYIGAVSLTIGVLTLGIGLVKSK